MGALSDRQIIANSDLFGMIVPIKLKSKSGTISSGISSYGYDVTLDKHFKIFRNVYNTIVDPKDFSKDIYEDVIALDHIIIPPHKFVLGNSVERFKIPRDILVLCIGKSTYARCGISTIMTPLEPEWEGTITIEIANATDLPVKVYVGEGIVQLIFLTGDTVCDVSYADKKGKYQHQDQLTTPRK